MSKRVFTHLFGGRSAAEHGDGLRPHQGIAAVLSAKLVLAWAQG